MLYRISLKFFKYLILFICPIFLFGEEILKFEGIWRVRAEEQIGFDTKGYGEGREDDYILSRLRLDFKLKPSKNLEFFFQFQDSRAEGTYFKNEDFKGKNDPFRDPLDINQFYFNYKFLKNFELKIGRQSISFGDRRIFGPGEWGNTGRYIWDALNLKYENKFVKSNFIYGTYILHQPDIFPDKRLKDLWAFGNYNSIKNLPFNLDLFYVFSKDKRGETVKESNYIGFRIEGKFKKFLLDSTFSREWGKFSSSNIDSYSIVFNFGYLLDNQRNEILNFQYVMGSGDKNPNDNVYNTYDGAFGGADTVLYGWMNLFFIKNLNEYRLEYIRDFSKDFNFRVEYHFFYLDEKKDGWYSPSGIVFRDKSGKSGDGLGKELDIIFKLKYLSKFEVLFGSSFFKAFEFVRKNFGDDKAKWYFIQNIIHF